MDINLQVRFYTNKYEWLCFKHAVKEVMKGEDVKTEVDDYSSDYYTGAGSCVICQYEEMKKEDK